MRRKGHRIIRSRAVGEHPWPQHPHYLLWIQVDTLANNEYSTGPSAPPAPVYFKTVRDSRRREERYAGLFVERMHRGRGGRKKVRGGVRNNCKKSQRHAESEGDSWWAEMKWRAHRRGWESTRGHQFVCVSPTRTDLWAFLNYKSLKPSLNPRGSSNKIKEINDKTVTECHHKGQLVMFHSCFTTL